MKFTDNAFIEKMRKQTLEKVDYKIDTYFIKNNITTTKLYTIQILLSRDVVIQIISIKKAKKLRKIDN